MIDYRYKVFMAVAAHSSFSNAAAELCISQPAVSKQIKLLEQHTGALFNRQARQIVLTPLGLRIYKLLIKGQLIEKEIEAEVLSLRSTAETTGQLKIGSSTTISLYILPKVLALLHKTAPAIKVTLVNRNSQNILKALSQHEVDIACVESNQRTNTFYYEPFIQDEIIAVCATNSPYGQQPLNIKELPQTPLALREHGSGTLAVLNHMLESKGIKSTDLNVIARLGGTEALKNYLLHSEALGFLSALSVQKEIEHGHLRQVEIPELKVQRDFSFVLRKGEEMSAQARLFVKTAHTTWHLSKV